MRDIRNKIAHDYLPSQTKEIFFLITDTFFPELELTLKNIQNCAVFIDEDANT